MPTDSTPLSIPASAITTAAQHIRDILEQAVEHSKEHAAIVVWDAESDLSIALAQAYRVSLPNASFLQFGQVQPEEILQAFEGLSAKDLVVLVQSTRFQLNAFRIRLELFKRSIKVIEHPHLARMPGPEALVYIDSLAYDATYYRGVGHALKKRIDRAQKAVVDSGGAELIYPMGLDTAKLNIGDYTDMPNIGGQYPIGEVFTESKDLEAVRGRVRISIFGDLSFTINKPDTPITLIIEKGRVIDTIDSTPAFNRVLESIREQEGQVWVRELGFGMNRAFSQERRVCDVGSFERMCGVHLSLGAKHVVYNKPGIKKKTARQHVDVFVLTHTVTLDDEIIYQDGAWLVTQ